MTSNLSRTDRLPAEVTTALIAIANGARADDVESATLDFKADPTVVAGRHGRKHGDLDGQLFEMLLNACICFANGSEGAAHIVLGVTDRVTGAEAFSGTNADPEKIRLRVQARTQPGLSVDAWEINTDEIPGIEFPGKRLIIIRVPEVSEIYTRQDGGGHYRSGTDCLPLDQAARDRLRGTRSNRDFTARPSRLTIDDLDPQALVLARSMLAESKSVTAGRDDLPSNDRELLNQLGVLTDNGRLTVAAEILFGRPNKLKPMVRYFWNVLPLGEPIVDTMIDGPLIAALPKARELVMARALDGMTRIELETGQELAIPAISETVLDEALTNALVHRDWSLLRPVVIEHNPRSLSIASPGGLVPGVDPQRLLSTKSIPRNPCLMRAMRLLGLAEEASRGFDRMWKALLNAGRPAPLIECSAHRFDIRIPAGPPNQEFLRGLSRLRKRFGADIISNYATLTILWALFHQGRIPLEEAAQLLQSDRLQVADTLAVLTDKEILESPNPSASINPQWWHLSQAARDCFPSPDALPSDVATSIDDWIVKMLDSGQSVTAAQVAAQLEVKREEITAALRKLRQAGRARIDPEGPQRGPHTRWIGTGDVTST